MSTIDYIRDIKAKKSFGIKDDFKIVEFNDVTEEIESPDHVEIFMETLVDFTGKIPESYRALNHLIADWVDDHKEELTQALHPKLIAHIKEKHEGSDISAIEEELEHSPVWADQLDYMPRPDEKNKNMIIEIELVLEHEPFEGAWEEN